MSDLQMPPFFDFHVLHALNAQPSREAELLIHLGWHPVQLSRVLGDLVALGVVAADDDGTYRLDVPEILTVLEHLYPGRPDLYDIEWKCSKC
jgi:hypothetical protein